MAQKVRSFDLPVVIQSDPEGNDYIHARDVAVCFITEDMQQTFDDLAEAEDYGLYEDDLTQVLLVYP